MRRLCTTECTHLPTYPQRDQRGSRDPRKHCQIIADGECYAQLMVEIQELCNQLTTSQPQGSYGPKA